MKQKLALDFDDLCYSCHNLEIFQKLKEHYPELKVTLFTIPMDIGYLRGKPWSEFMRESKVWRDTINKLDWVELGVHGLAHMQNEFMCEVSEAIQKLQAGEKVMQEMGMKYKKIFKAPFWQMTDEVARAIEKRGYVIAIDRNKSIPKGLKKYYQYNWSIEEPFPKTLKVIKGHGHIARFFGSSTPNTNGLDGCFTKLMKIPDVEFKFVSEIIKEKSDKDTSNN